MEKTKSLVILLCLLASTIAKAEDVDDVILEELKSDSEFQVVLKGAGHAQNSSEDELQIENVKSDGLVVSLRPAR
jgi:hypothetical protein